MTAQEMLSQIKSGCKKKVILDTDTYNEIDDQYALAYCYLADSIDLLSVNAAPFYNNNSTGFEDGMLKSYDEIKKVLSLTDPDYKTPVYMGSRTTITLTGEYVDSPAARNIIDTVKASDEPVYVLAIGAATNVASALMIDPSIRDNMAVIWLGASLIGGTGPEQYETAKDYMNNNVVAEFNLDQDYKAGQVLVNSGVPLLLCPAWGVVSVLTSNMWWTERLKDHNPVCDYLYEITEKVHQNAGGHEGWVRTIWDIAAPAILDAPECAAIEIKKAPVLTDSHIYAYDSTRHDMLYLSAIDRQCVLERTWDIITNA